LLWRCGVVDSAMIFSVWEPKYFLFPASLANRPPFGKNLSDPAKAQYPT